MVRQSSHSHGIRVRKSESGMDRFFSRRNLCRYRKLAGDDIGDAERRRIIEDLAEELKSFRREARAPAADGRRSFEENSGSRASDR